jgi:hypothetical protein
MQPRWNPRPLRLAAGLAAPAVVAATLWAQAQPNAAPAKPVGPRTISYNAHIRPILVENCFACHGPDSAARKAGLRLDRFSDATAMRGSNAAIRPGDPLASEMIRRISLPKADALHMPPGAGHEPLSSYERSLLTRWIAEGAEYEPHWSLIPPKSQALPKVRDTKWVRNPIDRFVLARLEKEGLTPAPEADKRSLIRRVALDITGLPPTADEIDHFLADPSPKAYEAMIDRYLASPHWGEHRGRYWLDAARYGDTHGIHIDNYREIWAYRDWVIDAFNRNLPFDRFTIEQLAGDLLPKPSLDQQVATGFTRCNITTSEGGAIDEEYKVLYTRDRTETFATVWLGTTFNCAVCHDHKFDPVSQRDFYSLSAFFNNTTQAAMDGNIKDTPPILFVPAREDKVRWEQMSGALAIARKEVETRRTEARAEFDRLLPGMRPESVSPPTDGLVYANPLESGESEGVVAPKAFVRNADSPVAEPTAGDFERSQAFTVSVWIKPVPGAAGAVLARMDEGAEFRGWDLWMEGGKVGAHIIHQWPGNALKAVTREPLRAGQWNHVALRYDGTTGRDSIKVFVDGAPRAMEVSADSLNGTIRTSTPFKIGQRSSGAHLSAGTALQDVRIYGRSLSESEIQSAGRSRRLSYLLSKGSDSLTPSQRDELYSTWLSANDPSYRGRVAVLERLQAEESSIRARGTTTHVASERKETPEAYVLFRGEYNLRRDKVGPATPNWLPSMAPTLPKNRYGLAKWVLSSRNPLTSRVTVNRFWQEIFGQGLVRTSGDFGITGELPSHPELLDWLALEFRRDWDIKRFFKLVLTSATYRQASVVSPDKMRRDPSNRLLARGPRYRMDGEMVRDMALATSGLLVRRLGGPSVKPYQPDGVWEAVAMIGSNTRDYKRDNGENLYRRSLYTFWKRSAPPASMEIFNAPNREVCTVRRERTNTPLQALVTLNDIQFVEAARVLATEALRQPIDDNQRIQWIAVRLLARPLSRTEQVVASLSLGQLLEHYQRHQADARQLVRFGETPFPAGFTETRLAAWTMFVNQMMNLDEVLNK